MFDEDFPLPGSANAADDFDVGAHFESPHSPPFGFPYDEFDDDLFAGYTESAHEATHDSHAAQGNFEHVEPPARSPVGSAASSEGRKSQRSRGSRGRGSRAGSIAKASVKTPKWRSGQVPTAPSFDGDIDKEPYCLRHYKKRLQRWIMITREFLPANEQALRAREQMKGEAEAELAEVDDSRYDHDDGISRLLEDLEVSFGEKELFRQGGAIREYESIGRLQGESIAAFVRRFRLLEQRLKDHKVPEYPEQTRVVKLLDGLRLDEKATASLLLAAGNQYNMRAVQNAIKIQYPAGMTITGIPLRSGKKQQPQKQSKPFHRRSWNTSWNTGADSSYDQAHEFDCAAEDEQHQDYEYQAEYDEMAQNDQFGQNDAEDDVIYDEEAQDLPSNDPAQPEEAWTTEFAQAVEALTVTSKKLADITRARGFYQTNDKKGKGQSKSKGKGKNMAGKSMGKNTSKGKTGKGKGYGKPSPLPNKTNFDSQRPRISEARCLGCNEVGHWIRDCPHQNTYSAQLATVGVVLDAEGAVVDHNTWMTSALAVENVVGLPSLLEGVDPLPHPQDLWDRFGNSSYIITKNPMALIQYAKTDATLMIADTGCQRQVAGVGWHKQRQFEMQPLFPLQRHDHCTFSFGPNAGVPSSCRWAYPVGLGGKMVVLGISQVEVNAPALFSRPAFEALGAVPDVTTGIMHYKALGTSSQLFLSKCGHLAIRIDEWPSEVFAWPVALPDGITPDVWLPGAFSLKGAKLQKCDQPARPPPHAELGTSMAWKVETPSSQ